ncbi:hypothetical protein GUJ93_ZPchr0005g15161 [Zizania palustris]|uniref:Uncharacterized protein n=1 Tax=Zizania palustris TaxID=103762 RepID=A0A8J5VIG1_ZIZPA|nr:hypothetical protein GUJ93_ZPchr0005g15161 [Zizania palustris]
MAEPRDPEQVDAEGVQAAESGALELGHLEGARATQLEASVPVDIGVAEAEETGPQATHSPLRASVDSYEDFLQMFELTDSPNQYPIVGNRGTRTTQNQLKSFESDEVQASSE